MAKLATQMSVDQILAGAKFYARTLLSGASFVLEWDRDADERVWKKIPPDCRDKYLDMVRGIAIAAFFETREELAAARAMKILGKESGSRSGCG